MNFNFNFKDKLGAARPSIRLVTNGRDLHHMEKSGVKRGSRCGQLMFQHETTADPSVNYGVM
jgi:hypothetical protein